jgi:hypothetical protein
MGVKQNMDSTKGTTEAEVVKEEIDVDAQVTLKIDMTVESLKDATASEYEDRLLPARELANQRLRAAQGVLEEARHRLSRLSDVAADTARNAGKLPGTKEFKRLAEAYNAANAVANHGARYEVELEGATANTSKLVIEGTLQVQDVNTKNGYRGGGYSEYHETLVELKIEIPFTAAMKALVKEMDAMAKDVEKAAEDVRVVTHLLAQKPKVAERTGRNVTKYLLSGRQANRAVLLGAGSSAINETLNGSVRSLSGPVCETLQLEAPKPTKKAKKKKTKKKAKKKS